MCFPCLAHQRALKECSPGTAGRVVTSLRASLSPENVDALVFLHRNTSYQWQSVASPDVVVKPEEQHNEAPALPVL